MAKADPSSSIEAEIDALVASMPTQLTQPDQRPPLSESLRRATTADIRDSDTERRKTYEAKGLMINALIQSKLLFGNSTVSTGDAQMIEQLQDMVNTIVKRTTV